MAYDSSGRVANGRYCRRFTWWILAGLVVLLLVSLAFARRHLAPILAQRPQLLAPPPAAAVVPRVYLRAGDVSPEGLGSTLQHFKQSIVLSNALGTSLLLAANDPYELRPYSTSEVYNGDRNFSLDATKACRIQAYVSQGERGGLVKGLCEGEAWALERMDEVRRDMAACTSVVDTDESETTNDMNGCVMGWVRERLAPAPIREPPTAPLTRPLTVGVHIRWGDTASAPSEDLATHEFYGSWALPNIVRVLADLRAYAHPHGIALSIAMQNADAAVLGFLGEPADTYTLLDSDDAIADLRALSQNDVLLLGESSYGVMAHLIAPPGLTLVEGGAFHKFTNTSGFGRHVVFMDEYSPEDLQLVVLPVDS
ncbi:hypothetical protein C8R46DRAFT_1186113 [Mycena filopes]|nr:hypothetical protein C8R46DRAFT_1186113 [Mycena filopes]